MIPVHIFGTPRVPTAYHRPAVRVPPKPAPADPLLSLYRSRRAALLAECRMHRRRLRGLIGREVLRATEVLLREAQEGLREHRERFL